MKAGTDPEAIAEYVRDQAGVVSPQAILERFEISAGTLRKRREALEGLGIVYADRPRLDGNAHGYGTAEQWTAEGRLFDA